ncbi:hypothetical protein D3C75_1276230 [compost metagenome]
MADVVQVELEADHEQQHGDADFGEQGYLVVGLDHAEHRRTDQDADHDVGDQHRLAQAHGNRPGDRRDDQQQGEFGVGTMLDKRLHRRAPCGEG